MNIIDSRTDLGEEGAGDEDLQQHGDDQLDDEQDDGSGTLLGDAAEAVANGRLGLQREQEGPRQRLHLHHTRRVIGRRVELYQRVERSRNK